MANRPQSRGACAFCGLEATKAAMTRHLEKCPRLTEAIETANAAQSGAEVLLHLRVQDAYDKAFWLDLEMRGGLPLKKLDVYLRAIWLECCGHLSEFSTSGFGSRKVGMAQTALKAFEAAPQLTHIYDFGTSSETLVSLVGTRRGNALTKHPIALLARNLIPTEKCQECEQNATHLCMECIYEDQKTGMLCDAHTEGHPHESYGGPLSLVNSPRLGMCGYDGPAEAPY